MSEETKDITTEETDEVETGSNTNWEAKYAAQKERQRSAKTAYEQRIANLENELKATKKSPEVKELKTDFGLLEKGFLRVAGVTDQDEVDLIKKWQKDTNKGIDELVDHPFVKAELETLRLNKANQAATSGIKGGTGQGSSAKDTPEYWLAKGERPPNNTPEGKALNRKIVQAILKQEKGGKQFYND